MRDSTKDLIRLYARAVNGDIDKILEFQEVLFDSMQEVAFEIEDKFRELLDEMEFGDEECSCGCHCHDQENYS